MILVHWKVHIEDLIQRRHGDVELRVPMYREGNQQFHAHVSYEHIIDFIALHQQVGKGDVIICNVMLLPSEEGGTWI